MKFKELITKPEAEVRRMLAELQDEAHDMAVKIRLNQQKNTQKLKFIKRDIARIKTYLKQTADSSKQ